MLYSGPSSSLSAHGVAAVLGWFALAASMWFVAYRRAFPRELTEEEFNSNHQIFVRTLTRHHTGMTGLFGVTFLIMMTVLTPLITPFDPLAVDVGPINAAPSWEHWMGTDLFGRDVMSRLLYGGRISLSIGFVAVLIAATVGTTVGASAAFLGGWFDNVVMFVVDGLLSLPRLVLLLTVVGLYRPRGATGIFLIVAILGLTSWMGIARIVRGEVLSLREREFVQAARALGLSSMRILSRHLVPNAIAPVIVYCSLAIGSTMLAEAGLSFLGLGVPPPISTWGVMINDGREPLRIAPWISIFPGIAITVAVPLVQPAGRWPSRRHGFPDFGGPRDPMSRDATATPELGMASSFRSVPDMWHHRVGSTPEAPAVRYKRDGRWVTLSWSQVGQRVRALTNALLREGIQPEDRCAILSETRLEWMIADVAILCAGAATTTIFPQTPDEDLVFLLRDSGARVVFADHPAQAQRLDRLRKRLPAIDVVVVFDGAPPGADEEWVWPLERFERQGRDFAAQNPDAYGQAHRAIHPGQLATLMYTSGTTGQPRGVMLSHDAWIYESEAIDALGLLSPADLQFLWLPLSHVFAKVLQLSFVRLGMPTVIDGEADALLPNLQQTRPTWMAAVPRTFERLRNAFEDQARSRGRVAWNTYQWALRIGQRVANARRQGENVPLALRLAWSAADRMVAEPIRDQLGGRLRFIISGGAPLAPEIAEYFDALGLTVLEGYGLTESAAASTVNRLGEVQFGTVGTPLPGCRAAVAEDGEILLQSRGLMTGYWNDPAGTRRAFTEDGFLKTGDVGAILPTGHVRITGRKKEIIVTSAGKNVAPLRFEQRLRARCPYVDHVVVHGDARPFCAAVLSLNPRAVAQWAREQQIAHSDPADLAAHARVQHLLQTYVDDVNRELAAFERIRRFVVVAEPFTEANGMLTPSSKVRREVVERTYRSRLDRLYPMARSAAHEKGA